LSNADLIYLTYGRIRGLTDDVKAVTSGQWLKETTFVESSLLTFSTLLAYLAAVLAANASLEGQAIILVLLFSSAGLLIVANECTNKLQLHGRMIEVESGPKKYARRLHLTEQLVKESGNSDWAIRLGMMQPKKGSNEETIEAAPKIM
jgi:hypothetical protein